jgi:hypothetical protein
MKKINPLYSFFVKSGRAIPEKDMCRRSGMTNGASVGICSNRNMRRMHEWNPRFRRLSGAVHHFVGNEFLRLQNFF